MPRPRTILAIGVLAYLVAWFLPVVKDGTTLAKGGLPGWEAFRVALGPLWPGGTSMDSWWSGALAILSALTNCLFLVASFMLLRAKGGVPRFLTPALFVAAMLNTWWFVLSGSRGDLRPGYYLWALAFFLVAIASRDFSGPRGQPAAGGPGRGT